MQGGCPSSVRLLISSQSKLVEWSLTFLFSGLQSLEPIWKPWLKKMKNFLEKDLSAGPHSVTLSLRALGLSLHKQKKRRLGRVISTVSSSFTKKYSDHARWFCLHLHQGWLASEKVERKELEPKQQALSKTKKRPQHSDCEALVSRGMSSRAHDFQFPLFNDIWKKRGPTRHMAQGLSLKTASGHLSKGPSEELIILVNWYCTFRSLVC